MFTESCCSAWRVTLSVSLRILLYFGMNNIYFCCLSHNYYYIIQYSVSIPNNCCVVIALILDFFTINYYLISFVIVILYIICSLYFVIWWQTVPLLHVRKFNRTPSCWRTINTSGIYTSGIEVWPGRTTYWDAAYECTTALHLGGVQTTSGLTAHHGWYRVESLPWSLIG